MLKSLLAIITASFLLAGCTYEDESQDKVVIIKPKDLSAEEANTQNFLKIARNCITKGEKKDALDLDALFSSSLDKSFKPYLLFQKEKYTILHAQCMQKVANNGYPDFIDKILVRPGKIAVISRDFYAQDNPQEGAYWFDKLINLQGMTKGYYTAGVIFILNKKTLPYGAKLLAESALNGNKEARQVLMQVNSTNNLKRKYSQYSDL